jgi:hypothetical protein
MILLPGTLMGKRSRRCDGSPGARSATAARAETGRAGIARSDLLHGPKYASVRSPPPLKGDAGYRRTLSFWSPGSPELSEPSDPSPVISWSPIHCSTSAVLTASLLERTPILL